jgi:hypothetical protein
MTVLSVVVWAQTPAADQDHQNMMDEARRSCQAFVAYLSLLLIQMTCTMWGRFSLV